MVIKYCIIVLHPLLYNLLEIFIFWKISKIWYFWHIRYLIFSKISWYLWVNAVYHFTEVGKQLPAILNDLPGIGDTWETRTRANPAGETRQILNKCQLWRVHQSLHTFSLVIKPPLSGFMHWFCLFVRSSVCRQNPYQKRDILKI